MWRVSPLLSVIICILIWVTCRFVKEKLPGASTDLYGILSDRWSFWGDTISFLVLWNIDFFNHNFIERGGATRTCAITTSLQQKHWRAARKPDRLTISLHQNIHVRHENLSANSGRPWMIDARILHYSYCKLFISIYTILQRTPTILLHRTNCTQQRNATHRLYSFGNIISFHHICVCLCYWQYSMYCLGQSLIFFITWH